MQVENHSTKKRSRSQNWLDKDKTLLRGLVMERIGVIENKSSDTATNNKKAETWLDLQNSFNCMCKGSQRTILQLKNQWGILKLNDKRRKVFEPEVVCKTDDTETLDTDPLDSEEFNDDDDEDTNDEFECNQISQKRIFAAAEDVAGYEIQCRREIHRVQFQNERKKGKNLALEAVLIKTKTEYYRRKLLSLNNNSNTDDK